MEKTSEIMKELANSKKINVEKNNGIKERFSYEKLLKSLVMVETPFFESDKNRMGVIVFFLKDGVWKKIIHLQIFFCQLTLDVFQGSNHLMMILHVLLVVRIR